MKKAYVYKEHCILEENGKFGILDREGHLLFPASCDNIYAPAGAREGMGFILCQNGKFGYVEFPLSDPVKESCPCATAFLPCIYDRIEARRNGLSLFCNENEETCGELWFDYQSRTLYRNTRWLEGFGEFDGLLHFDSVPCLPVLKRAGKKEWVKAWCEGNVELLQSIPTDLYGLCCVLCAETVVKTQKRRLLLPLGPGIAQQVEEYEEPVEEYVEYSLLLLYPGGWRQTEAKRTLAELYAEIPTIAELAQRKKKWQEPHSLFRYDTEP